MLDERRLKIRVLVAGLEPIVEAIIKDAISDQADIELIALCEGPQEPLAVIAEWCPDVVIIPGATVPRAAGYFAALSHYPSIRLVEIRRQEPVDEEQSETLGVYGVRLVVANPTTIAVVEAIRAAAAGGA